MCLWPALLQMSRPEPAWFGGLAPAAAKSGNEVSERVVLGHFPLVSTQLKSNRAVTSGMAHSSLPLASWRPGHKAGDDRFGGIEQDKGSL